MLTMCDLSRPWELEWQKARENRSPGVGGRSPVLLGNLQLSHSEGLCTEASIAL